MASADPCCLSLTSRLGLPSKLPTAWHQVSPDKSADFPRIPARSTAPPLDGLDFVVLCPPWPECPGRARPGSRPHIGFAFLRSRVCLRLRLGPSPPEKDSHLPSQCPCWAYNQSRRSSGSATSFSNHRPPSWQPGGSPTPVAGHQPPLLPQTDPQEGGGLFPGDSPNLNLVQHLHSLLFLLVNVTSVFMG